MRFLICCGLVVLSVLGNAQDEPIYLDQGWDAEQREEFYFTAQGSQLIPFKWFLQLERADSEELFRHNSNLSRFGFITTEPSKRNPEGLPVGFVRDGVDPVASDFMGLKSVQRSVIAKATRFEVKKAYLGAGFDEKYYPREQESWFGFTCAACHTHQIRYQGATVRIDGGSTQADVESFLRELGRALQATCEDDQKLERFAIAVGRREYDLHEFKKEVQQISSAVNQLVQRNKAKHPYGYARLDAFGAILNAVCETALSEPENHRSSDAPVSYPSLWNTPEYSYVQWNASAPSAEARNVGEVLGVFGTYTLAAGPTQFDSTVRLGNLVRLEHELIKNLKSPDWPEAVLGPLDDAKVAAGRILFRKNCESCHAVRVDGDFVRNDQGRIPVRSNTLTEIQTDSQFLKNLNPQDTILAGGLQDLLGGAIRVPRASMLGAAVREIISNRSRAEMIDVRPLQPGPQDPPHPDGVGSGYIARPLEGIWASAPYFHNGSVPNLYETLLPASERSSTFWVGNTEFDSVNVGFVTDRSEIGSEFRVCDQTGQPIVGNSNAGHEGHGANESEGFTQTFENGQWRDFSDEERYALVEYMKSLSPNETDVPKSPAFEQIPDGEQEMIKNIVDATVTQMRARYADGDRMLRSVHPKDHGCVTAKFEVHQDLPEEYRVGVFQPGAVYECYIRFSNAAVRVDHDSRRGADGNPVHGSRGMAIKLVGVHGESLLPPHGSLTQDFLMINQPVFTFANVEDYELLSTVLVENNDDPRAFFAKRFTSGTDEQKARAARTKQLVERIQANEVGENSGAFFPPPASPVDNPYFSAAPFLFGPDRVMKFRAMPVGRSNDVPNVDDPNYLRTGLIARLSKQSVEFDFGIQVRTIGQVDPATDIENASVEWKDDFVSVARITIAPQKFDSPEQRVHCEKLFFSPWHGVADHRPIGGINRLRKAVYLASGKFRNLPKEPASIPTAWSSEE
ncbi:hypothetical protein Mal15_23530 [Stieleria maiorica]|uniref:Cytochrome c domain-containing protein n=1 Tax=Stieleria maiorica TaxID=2795974 RepID=A0A5B9MAI4_9BACT|nr:catalase family protein [Stieleria maiorica]QEF98301.1 hypothetical protein Mal15_23530 [Stieleria maiorica]